MSIIQYQWCDSTEPSPDRVSQHTMARVFIKVGDRIVTSVYDRFLEDNDDHIYVPLAYVAEWLTANWWHLWYEAASVSGDQRPGFRSRHDLSYAGNGFVLPRLTLVPVGRQIRVVARGWTPRHAPLEFRGECDVMLARHELEREFRSLVGAVIARLRAKRTPFEALESEWRVIESLDSDEWEFCKATALMGLDPFDIEVNTAERIARVWNQTDPAIREEALGAAQEHSLVAIQDWLECWLESAEQARSGDDWKNVRNGIRRGGVSEDLPWRQGYVDARAVRGELGDGLGRFEFAQDGPCAIWSDDVEEIAVAENPRVRGVRFSFVRGGPQERGGQAISSGAGARRLHRARRKRARDSRNA